MAQSESEAQAMLAGAAAVTPSPAPCEPREGTPQHVKVNLQHNIYAGLAPTRSAAIRGAYTSTCLQMQLSSLKGEIGDRAQELEQYISTCESLVRTNRELKRKNDSLQATLQLAQAQRASERERQPFAPLLKPAQAQQRAEFESHKVEQKTVHTQLLCSSNGGVLACRG